ncbi:MAG: hypothetical protein BGN82_08760 [Alphaproteobacteria bacterium 65-7]|nr:MAG: hypothetical protein BGN82_08760 [Alphaproteobacteria bacterium 65-7]
MPQSARILLVDADPVPRASIAEQLTREGYEVVTAADLAEAVRTLAGGPPAFALLDSAATAAALRAEGLAAPMLVLTDDGDSPEGGGAFESLARPFRFSTLLARLHALSSHPAEGDGAVRIGPYTFHPSAKLLQAGGRKVRLTEKETNILKFLHASAGTVPRDILLHEVWGYGPAVATHTLETHIYRLRKKIEEDPAKARILLTEAGGYRLSA